jgi:chemotaxis signal transduction protein
VADGLSTIRSASDLAREFDRTFEDPARVVVDDTEGLLAIRVAGDPYAVRLRDVSGLVVDRKIVALPTRLPALLGVVGLRGGVAPVYGLRALLGYEAIREAPRWLLLIGAGPLFGLAFEDFDGHRRTTRADISSRQNDTPGSLVPESVRVDDDGRRGLINLATVTDTIQSRVAANDRNKEQ